MIITSANKDNFTSFFSDWNAFIFFLTYLIAIILAIISSIMNNNIESGHPFLASEIK